MKNDNKWCMPLFCSLDIRSTDLTKPCKHTAYKWGIFEIDTKLGKMQLCTN